MTQDDDKMILDDEDLTGDDIDEEPKSESEKVEDVVKQAKKRIAGGKR